jgi:hypothetical protein
MYRVGRIAVWLGIVLIAAGLVVGFTAMFADSDSVAVNTLGLVPLGFVVLLAGTVMTQLAGTSENRDPDSDD